MSRGAEELPQFSVRIAPLAAYIQAHPATVMVDSLDKLQQVNPQCLLPHVLLVGNWLPTCDMTLKQPMVMDSIPETVSFACCGVTTMQRQIAFKYG